MTTGSNHFVPEVAQAELAVSRVTRPLYWAVRRELWENRSIVMAPLIISAIVLFASLIAVLRLGRKILALPAGDADALHRAVAAPFSIAPAPILFAGFVLGLFYSIDALYGERRDRSILFWKSLPLSDRTTVLSKALIPLAVVPAIGCALSLAVQINMLLFASAVLPGSGVDPTLPWREFRFFPEMVVMLYGVTAHVLWFAPIYGWLLLLSGWARRAPFLWAVLPPMVIAAVEAIVFQTSHFGAFLRDRWMGAMSRAFVHGKSGDAVPMIEEFAQLTPIRFVSSPSLWIGLVFTAGCLAAAVRVRRNRDPV